jgi:teichuronic acid biosynthesis glycosyltransferase TuaG
LASISDFYGRGQKNETTLDASEMSKMENNLVSIVIPTHNRSSFISRALSSVLKQTYRNWEAIIILDNCTDNTQEILSNYMHDKRVRMIHLKKKVGAAEARNVGMKTAKGGYISFLDDDDEWHPQKLAKQVEVFQKGMKVCIVGCNCQFTTKYGTYKSSFAKKVNFDTMLYRNGVGSFTFCLTKKKYIESVSIEKDLKACQDWDLWLKIFQKTGLNGFVIPEILAYRDLSHNLPRLTTTLEEANESHWKFICQTIHLMNSTQKAYRFAIHYSRMNKEAPEFKHYLKSIGYLVNSFRKASWQEALSILFPNWFFGIDTKKFAKRIGVLFKNI